MGVWSRGNTQGWGLVELVTRSVLAWGTKGRYVWAPKDIVVCCPVCVGDARCSQVAVGCFRVCMGCSGVCVRFCRVCSVLAVASGVFVCVCVCVGLPACYVCVCRVLWCVLRVLCTVRRLVLCVRRVYPRARQLLLCVYWLRPGYCLSQLSVHGLQFWWASPSYN